MPGIKILPSWAFHTFSQAIKSKRENVKCVKGIILLKKFYKATTLGLFDIKVLRLPDSQWKRCCTSYAEY